MLFGFVLYFLLRGVEGEILESLRELSALAYGIAGLLAGIGIAIVYWRGAGAAAVHQTQFRPVLALSALPETAELVGFSFAFILLGYARNLPAGIAVIPPGAQVAAILIGIGSLGAPMMSVLAMSAYDLQSKVSWKKGLRRASIASWFPLVFLVLALLSLSAT